MEELSKKAIIVLSILKELEAIDEAHKTHIYAILDKLEETDLKTILPNEEDYELENIECEMTQKSISTTLAGLVRKGFVAKTGQGSVRIGQDFKNLRGYYLIKK